MSVTFTRGGLAIALASSVVVIAATQSGGVPDLARLQQMTARFAPEPGGHCDFRQLQTRIARGTVHFTEPLEAAGPVERTLRGIDRGGRRHYCAWICLCEVLEATRPGGCCRAA